MIVNGALMANLLGLQSNFPISLDKRLDDLRSIPGVKLHWYEKEKEKEIKRIKKKRKEKNRRGK